MRTLTTPEYETLGMPEVMRLMKEEWKESVGLEDHRGIVSMVLSYQPPAEACACPPPERDWWCSYCAGFVVDAEAKRLRDALQAVADFGMPGYGEAGCVCCFGLEAIDEVDFGSYTVKMAEAGEHLVACPVGKALGRAGQPNGDGSLEKP